MKSIIRKIIINTAALWIISKLASGMSFGENPSTIFLTGALLAAVSIFAKPVINILLLPLNLVTFGLFNWVSSAIMFYIVSLIIKDFAINYFSFAGFNNQWIDIPGINLNGILAYIAFSFVFSIIYSSFNWLSK